MLTQNMSHCRLQHSQRTPSNTLALVSVSEFRDREQAHCGHSAAMSGCTTLNENTILSMLVDSVTIFALVGTTKLIIAGLPLLVVLDIANEVCNL